MDKKAEKRAEEQKAKEAAEKVAKEKADGLCHLLDILIEMEATFII